MAMTIPPLLKPWIERFLTAVVVMALTWAVAWLKLQDINIEIPEIKREVAAMKQEVADMKLEVMTYKKLQK